MIGEVIKMFSVNEVELVYRTKIPREGRIKILRSQNAFDVFYNAWDMRKINLNEEFKVLLLDAGASCLGLSNIAEGGVTSCVADPRIIFSLALKARATAIVLAHNHPSGHLAPSNADIAMTQRFVDAGKLLDIKIFDHLIIGENDYLSMADEGMLPPPRL